MASIEYVRADKFYDLHVPGAEHYFAHGFVNHNSGKSYALCYEAFFLCAMNPNCWGLIGAPTYRMLEDSTKRAFFEFLELEEINYFSRPSDNLVVLTDFNATVIFRSLDSPERLRATNLAWFGVDELTYCQEDGFTRLEGRLRDPKAIRQCGYGVWTPNGYDWVYNRFIKEKRASHGMTFASPRENFHLGNSYYDSLKATYDERFYQQEVLGEYLSMRSGRVYYAFDRAYNLRLLEWDTTLPIAWSLDFNVDPMCSILAQVRDETSRVDMMRGIDRKVIHVLDEICIPNATIEMACSEFARKTERFRRPGRLLSVNLYGDSSGRSRTHAGPSAWQTVKDCLSRIPGLQYVDHTRPANPQVKDRAASMNAAFCSANQDRRLFVDAGCKTLITDLDQVTWKADSSGNTMPELDKSNPKLTHCSDSLGYLVDSEMPLKYGGSGFKTGTLI